MLKNYLIIAIRQFLRKKAYSFINIAGISISLLCSLFIALWVADEISYDKFHKNGDNIYQVWRHLITEGQIDTWTSQSKPSAETLKAEYPEVEQYVITKIEEQFVVTLGEKSFREFGGYASVDFFDLFSFPLLKGNPREALEGTSSVVITERTAKKLFGDDWQRREDVIGKSLTIDHRKEFTITAVAQDPPENSSIQFDVLIPARDFTDRFLQAEGWYYMIWSLYLKLPAQTSIETFNDKIREHFEAHDEGPQTKLFVQPFEDVYLHSTYKEGVQSGGRIEYVRIFSAIAVFLLAIACINFVNLATARSSQRAREIGVRKVVGARRYALIAQFMTESIGTVVVSFALSLAAFFLLLPAFNTLTGKHLEVNDLNGTFLLVMVLISLVVGAVAGIYPALFLSGFNPVATLRGTFRLPSGNLSLRKTLVVFQFAISVLMIVTTAGVYLQLDYVRTINLGMQRVGLVYTRQEGLLRERYETVVQELLNSPGIASVTTSGHNPLRAGSNTTSVKWQGSVPTEKRLYNIINTNYDFAKTMGMEMAAGRDFTWEHRSDTITYLVNEEAAKVMGGDVVGMKLRVYGQEGEIVGVVKNFSMNSLYSPIEPTIIRFYPPWAGLLFIRTKAGETTEALASLKSVCERINPEYPFEYTFVDDEFERTYRSEAVLGQLSNIFAVVAIFISCLGLFGLTAFIVEQRTKEVGIRKVLGASVVSITALLSRNFIMLVLIGALIAIPVASYFINSWLDGFAAHINMSWWIFAIAVGVVLIIALFTVGFQSIRAALMNPAETLKTE